MAAPLDEHWECDMPTPSVDQVFATAVQYHTSGDLESAERTYREILRQMPSHAPTLSNLGALLVKTGREDEAVRCYQLAITSDPYFADPQYNLGNVHRRANRLVEAADRFRACLQINPNHTAAAYNLGVVSVTLGRLEEAEQAFRKSIEHDSAVGEANLRLGEVLLRLGRPSESVAAFRRYAEAHPNDARGMYNLALALANDGKSADATELLHRALKLKPDYAEAHNALGLALELLGRKDDASHHYEKAVQLKPDLADAWSNLGINLAEQGRTEDAIVSLRNSLRHRPLAPAIHSNLLLLLNYSSQLTSEQVRDEHLAWGEKFTTPVPPRPAPHLPHDPHRKLRVGYLSCDFRTHTVAGLIEILLRHHDRQQFEVYAYSVVQRPDQITEQLKGLADVWRPIVGRTDSDAADLIHQDRIDVLVDLGGHTAGNRLITFACRPACVQVSLFGYPNTTGMAAMDYRVSDPVSDPQGASEHLYCERLIRLPQTAWVYHPPADAPPVGPLPGLQRRVFTFGCLNNSAKISDACLVAWSKLIQATPGSRLVLMAGQSHAGLKRLADRFVRAGILRDRIQLINRLQRDQYFARYGEIDVSLDPFPYNGGVTTCDSLWMGVPVFTVAGTCYRSRQGVMQMLAVGLDEFIAPTVEDLVPLAKMWMNRRDELSTLRAGLRDRMLASPLCDGPSYVRHWETALRNAWCETLPRSYTSLRPE
jgi:predicted O-linked N-acetylglucosamine transferase (SPINDLY family)